MAISDSQKRASAKWDKEHTRIVSCKLRTAEHAAFKAYAEARGKTISGVLLDYVRRCISDDMEQPKTP